MSKENNTIGLSKIEWEQIIDGLQLLNRNTEQLFQRIMDIKANAESIEPADEEGRLALESSSSELLKVADSIERKSDLVGNLIEKITNLLGELDIDQDDNASEEV